MKTIPSFRRTDRRHRGFRALLTLAGCSGVALGAEEAAAPATEPPKEEAAAAESRESPGEYRSWVNYAIGGASVAGDEGAYQRRVGLPTGVFGGIESFHYEQDVRKDGLFKVDGRGIFDNHDYAIRLELSRPEKGFVRVGYEAFRTWYDGSGGYFPGNDLWFNLSQDEFAVDRSEAWIEAGLRLAKWPELTVRYSHQTREGDKDSTTWGQTTLTGGAGIRSITPAAWNLDEVRDLWAADVRHTLGKTDLGLGLRFENARQDDRHEVHQLPGEPGDAYVTQKDGMDSTLFNLHAFTESRISKKFLFTAGYAFTDLDTDLSGYRVYGTAYDPDFAQRLPSVNTFEGLQGGSRLSQHVVNLNLMFTPWESWYIVPSARFEKQDIENRSQYGLPAAAGAWTPLPYQTTSDRGLLDVSESLELRYAGVTNWVFFARANWLQGSGDLEETQYNLGTAALAMQRATDDSRSTQKYSAGASWHPLRRLHLAAEYYHKIRRNEFDHTIDTTSNATTSLSRYPAYLRGHDYDTDDANVRMTWRPAHALTLVARYDFQFSTITTTPDLLSSEQSSETTSHILSGNVSWTPWSRLYLQAGASYVTDETETPISSAAPSVQNAENDYWMAHFSAGFVLDDKTDLTAEYHFYRADNYEDNSAFGQPYGAGLEEQGITAAVVRRLSNRVQVSLKYGFFTSHDRTSGGNNDFDSHLLYSTVQYRF
jgi:hypothetical protein